MGAYAAAYLAEGKLFLQPTSGKAEPVESAFAQEQLDQAARTREKNEWKMRSQTGQMMAGGALWGGAELFDTTARMVRFGSVCRTEKPGQLLYALETAVAGGLFLYDTAAREERRLFHRTGFRVRHLSCHPERPQAVFALGDEDGTVNLAVVDTDGRNLRVVTEGDSVDEAPAWVPGEGQRLVFQSAGIGRNQEGHFAGTGPYAVQLLDLDQGAMETLAEDPKSDFLQPRMTEDGRLLCIRRPYQTVRAPGLLAVARDVVLFPFRLIWAVVGFLNFFSLMFSGNPLLTAGGPKREGPTPRHLMLWGKVVDAERAERSARKGEPAALVPRDWRLVCRGADGAEEVLAESVVAYDLAPDGTLYYTNGSAVFRRKDGATERVCLGSRIEEVIALG